MCNFLLEPIFCYFCPRKFQTWISQLVDGVFWCGKSGKSRKILLSPIDLKITETILQIQANKLSVFLTLESVPFLRYWRSKYKKPSNDKKRKNSPKTRCNIRIVEVSGNCSHWNGPHSLTQYPLIIAYCLCVPNGGIIQFHTVIWLSWMISVNIIMLERIR